MHRAIDEVRDALPEAAQASAASKGGVHWLPAASRQLKALSRTFSALREPVSRPEHEVGDQFLNELEAKLEASEAAAEAEALRVRLLEWCLSRMDATVLQQVYEREGAAAKKPLFVHLKTSLEGPAQAAGFGEAAPTSNNVLRLIGTAPPAGRPQAGAEMLLYLLLSAHAQACRLASLLSAQSCPCEIGPPSAACILWCVGGGRGVDDTLPGAADAAA